VKTRSRLNSTRDPQGCWLWSMGYANGLQAGQALRGQTIGRMMSLATSKL
jgi:hypothetical protein